MNGGTGPAETPVESYRRVIERLDHALVELYAARRLTVARLWEYKRRHGLPMRDLSQEREVVVRARRWGTERGLDPQVAEELIRWVMTHSPPSMSRRPDATTAPSPSVPLPAL